MTHVPTIARPIIWSPILAGSGVIAARTSRGATSTPLDADLVGSVHAQRVDGLELVDEVRAQGVLERDALDAGQPARNEQHLLVLDVDALDLADALREREHLGALKGSVVCQSPSCQMIGGLRHSSIVVQIENTGAKA